MAEKNPQIGEVTKTQSITFFPSYDGLMPRQTTTLGTYTQLRATRKDSTIALATGVFVSSILAGSWNLEADDDVSEEARLFMEHVLPLREDFLRAAILYGRISYGWQGYEKVFETDGERIYIESLKPLLQDMTSVLLTEHGRFDGYKQNPMSGVPVVLPAEKCLHIAFDVEGSGLYGYPLLENVRAINDMWKECNDGARRYDKKISGVHWVIKYPPGTGTVDGVETDNGVIAASLLTALESSGCIAIPTTTATVLQELVNAEVGNLYAWHIELLAAESKHTDFNNRLNYLDKQKVRGLWLCERAILEGQFGNKAEAGIHGDTTITNFEQIDKEIVSAVNQQLINQLVELNYGPDMVGKIRLVALPLVDTQIAFLRELYKKLNDSALDVEVLRDKLDLPGLAPEDVKPEIKEPINEETINEQSNDKTED